MKKKEYYPKILAFSLIFTALFYCRSADITDPPFMPDPPAPLIVPEMVLVPAGEFRMGDNFNEGNPNERPVHTVYLDDYYIGKYEVTTEQFVQFLNEMGNKEEGGSYWIDLQHPSGLVIPDNYETFVPKWGRDKHPVVEVSWYGARAYCDWLSAKTGDTYRLPTEAEWEKATRGTDQRRYPWGNHIEPSYVNYWFRTYWLNSVMISNGLTPVGFFDGNKNLYLQTSDDASPYGARDMAGNVKEWISDFYSDYYYTISPYANPEGPETGNIRVTRGGDVSARTMRPRTTVRMRSAYRYYAEPELTWFYLGFRCVKEY